MPSDAQPRLSDEEKLSEAEHVGKRAAGSSGAAANKPSLLDKLLPSWAASNLRSSRSRKIWLRCWVASWACYVIILPNASLKVLGNAAFFAVLASLMIPPNMPVQLFIFVLATMVVGICLGWGIGAAGMRAALASRDQVVLKQSLEQEAQSAAGLANPDALFKSDIFAGKFLDTASSIVFGAFLGFGTFIFALIRAYAPKLMLMSVFGTIALDIYCTYGALFPFGQYTLLNSLLTSIACYVGIGIILIVFLFPETLNHSTLVSTSALIGELKSIVEIQEQILASSPDELAPGSPLPTKFQALRVGSFAHIQQRLGGLANWRNDPDFIFMMASMKFIGAEFSWGKWNADDVRGLQEPLVALVNRAGALQSFIRAAGHRHARTPEQQASAESSTTSETDEDDGGFARDTVMLRQLRERHRTAEVKYSVRMQDILPVIASATADLRASCAAGLGATQTLLDGINLRRYARKGAKESDQHLQDLDNALERLKVSLESFKSSNRLDLLQPFHSVFADAKVSNLGALPIRSLYVSFVFSSNLIVLSDSVVKFMESVQKTATKRRRNRVWAPGGLRALGKALLSRGEVSDQAAGEDNVPQPDEEVKKDEKPYKLDPDSKPPTNILQRLANSFHRFYKWTKTPEALFCFRYAVLSVVLYIPAVARRSSHFYYVERGLWSLIMAQTTLNIYASDQIFNYVTRILGTFFGAVFGLLSWYIGSAKSNGSSYGSAASVAVFLIPLTFLRLFSPPQYLAGVLLFVATWVLIMGYSWIDGHLPTIGSPGIGWPIAWKRFVTVMIGAAASFILMMLPPKSGRKAVRLRNASTISSLSFLYSDIIAAWLNSKEGQPTLSVADFVPGIREKLFGLAAQLEAVKVQTAIARWEGSIRGAWPGEEYFKLASVQTDMMASMSLLAGALAQVDSKMRLEFLQRTMVINPNFVADVIQTFALVSQALRTGEPLPQAMHQNLLDRFHYHGRVGRQTHANADANGSGDASGKGDVAHQPHLEYVSQYEYMFYATAICAIFEVLEGLNELRTITVRLCGELPLEGFARWKEEYDRAHVMA